MLLKRNCYHQFEKFQQSEKKDPEADGFHRMKNSKDFSCDTCVLNGDQEKQPEEFLVKNHGKMAKE